MLFSRASNSLLQACKQVHTLHGGEVGDLRLEAAKRAVSVNQHHDAVTGTAKQHVTDDYALRLHKVAYMYIIHNIHTCHEQGNTGCGDLMMERLSSVSGCQLTSMCPLQNISQCEVTEQQAEFSVSLYNPLTSVVSRPVRLPVSSCDTLYSVTSETGDSLETQMVPIPTEVDLRDKYYIHTIDNQLSIKGPRHSWSC